MFNNNVQTLSFLLVWLGLLEHWWKARCVPALPWRCQLSQPTKCMVHQRIHSKRNLHHQSWDEEPSALPPLVSQDEVRSWSTPKCNQTCFPVKLFERSRWWQDLLWLAKSVLSNSTFPEDQLPHLKPSFCQQYIHILLLKSWVWLGDQEDLDDQHHLKAVNQEGGEVVMPLNVDSVEEEEENLPNVSLGWERILNMIWLMLFQVRLQLYSVQKLQNLVGTTLNLPCRGVV